MNKYDYLNKYVFAGLQNVHDGFDASGVAYFNQSDFALVLARVESLGVDILGIEPWKNGEFYDVATYEDYTENPTAPSWYWQAFQQFIATGEPLHYAATYSIPDSFLK